MGISDLSNETLFSILEYTVPRYETDEWFQKTVLSLRLVCTTFDSLFLQCIFEILNQYTDEDREDGDSVEYHYLRLAGPIALEQLRLGRHSPILDAIRQMSQYILDITGGHDAESLVARYQRALCFVASEFCDVRKMTRRWKPGDPEEDWPSMGGDRHTGAVAAAAYWGDLTLLESLLERGETINPFHQIFGDPLCVATQHGHQEAACMVLAVSTGLGRSRITGRTAIHWAALNGQEEVLLGLVHRYRALTNVQDHLGHTALSLAARSGRVGTSRILLEQKEAGTVIAHRLDRFPMELAAGNGHFETVRLFIHRRDTSGLFVLRSLRAAAFSGHVGVVKLLIDIPLTRFNEDWDKQYNDTLYAPDDVKDPYLRSISLLIRNNVAPNMQWNFRLMPSRYSNNQQNPQALGKEKIAILEAFLNRKDILLSPPNRNVKGPVEWAACLGCVKVMKLIIGKDPAVADCAGYKGRTPSSFAAEYGNEAVVKLLVNDYRARPDAVADDGKTPLFHAARWGQTNVMRFLLDQGAVADRTDSVGQTPLAYAARGGFVEPVKLVLDRSDVRSTT